MPLLLQVLRVRDAPAAPARARRGPEADRPRRAAPGQGAARAHRRGARPPSGRARASSPSSGFADFVDYVVWACGEALDRGLLPHTNLGVMAAGDLARLREVTASQGLMLESVNPDLVAHQGSPTKHPERAAGDDPRGRRAAHPVHVRDPGRDRRVRGRAGRRARGAGGLRPHPGGHPPELRPAPVLLRAGAGGHRRRGRRRSCGGRASPTGPHEALPKWANPISLDDLKRLIGEARRLLPGVGIQVPPNLSRVVAGAGRRGRDRPRRAERQRRPHLPRAPLPVAAAGARRGCRRTASRWPSGCASTRSTWTPSGSRAARARGHRPRLPHLQAAPRRPDAQRLAGRRRRARPRR